MKNINGLIRFRGNYWADGLRLAVLNTVLAAICSVTFVGTLLLISLINQHNLALNSRSREIAFPYPVLLLLYVFAFLAGWIWCGRRLPGKANTKTAVVGAAPLLGFALLGYAATAWALVLGERDPNFPAATVYVFGFLSTLILLAAGTSILVIYLTGRKSATRGFDVIGKAV